MDILKPGRDPKDWSLEVVCSGYGHNEGGCEALLLVREEDLYQTEHSGYFDEIETGLTFTCCSCGRETDLRGNEQPRNWQNFPTKKTWLKTQKLK